MKNSRDFFHYDYNTSLFPMKTTRFLVDHGLNRALDLSKQCVDSGNASAGFSPQTKAFASKPGYHLRRTVKLDPIAEMFLYDLLFRNRALFAEPKSEDCKHFGYRFDEDDHPLSATESYGGFRKAQAFYENEYEYSLSFDVASYFNSMRHHDIIEWFSLIGAEPDEVKALDVFLEGTAPGRSSDCWPQGMYSTKMMGGDFLRVVEENIGIRAPARIRFLDDFVLFSNSESDLVDDFFRIQKILGARGLSVNASKTSLKSCKDGAGEDETNEIRKQLLEKRKIAVQKAYTDDFDEAHGDVDLSDEEVRYISELLESKDMSEDDAELVVSLARGCENEVKEHLPSLAIKYPHLAKSVWALSRNISLFNESTVLEILNKASSSEGLQEYQLFWFSEIASHLNDMEIDVSKPLMAFYENKNATDLSRAKILEIESNDVWLRELRREHLASGRSDWMVWSSLVGSHDIISDSAQSRFSAIANSSYVNRILLDSIRDPEEAVPEDELDHLSIF